jgi:hypothetical protein
MSGEVQVGIQLPAEISTSIFATAGAICNHSAMTKLANLDRVVHQKLRVRDELAQSVCRSITMCAASLGEIPRLVIEYPLAFTKNPETGEFVSVVLFGVDPTQNLYWRDDRWNSDVVPLNVARQPFAVATAAVEGNTKPRALYRRGESWCAGCRRRAAVRRTGQGDSIPQVQTVGARRTGGG